MGIKSAISNRAKFLYDPRYRHMYLQRRVVGLKERNAAADRIVAQLPSYVNLPQASDTFERLSVDGYAMLPDLISPQQVSDIRQYFQACLAFDPYRPDLGKFNAPDGVPKGTHVAHFDHLDVVSCPHVLAVANNPIVLSAVADVLGAKPTISLMAAWWSVTHGERAQEAELYHRDVDDYRFVKLFVYLTDVDDESGPHAFVRGTHNIDKLTNIRRLSEEEVALEFGRENMLSFSGPAGTAFLENTYGIHRGVPPKTRTRLLFQVLYSLVEYVGGPKRPVAKFTPAQNGVALDRYVNRVYLR
ncbi:phytanoyl-CoA dioxygenase family protein [Bradyrhizobium japonicum]|uniref:Phytanoyl-CoA dioxygenase n=1 Tax=Bradyrhizobium japonicum TaxID=375 RepID=A0ABV2RUJ6_BRAJP|nr:phytanoyl-CoA dioxygenase family protein [Bradyrhizobium japonicum]UQD70218.1 phytanoyl-CoA dioxygenase family protein [Bradyrhizobium japonicum]WLB16847.1 phytanoyl-CoA dioxygenase family protein [Bradyrhizobium japonicum]